MPKLVVFYDHKQATNAETSFSPSAKKPLLLVDQWLGQGQSFDLVSLFD